MSVVYRWTCDRCGVTAETPGDRVKRFPPGWVALHVTLVTEAGKSKPRSMHYCKRCAVTDPMALPPAGRRLK